MNYYYVRYILFWNCIIPDFAHQIYRYFTIDIHFQSVVKSHLVKEWNVRVQIPEGHLQILYFNKRHFVMIVQPPKVSVEKYSFMQQIFSYGKLEFRKCSSLKHEGKFILFSRKHLAVLFNFRHANSHI